MLQDPRTDSCTNSSKLQNLTMPIPVLGIHIGHDASCALLIDGNVILALQEERFSRIKNHTGVPYHSLSYILSYLYQNNLHKNLQVAISSTHLAYEVNLFALLHRLYCPDGVLPFWIKAASRIPSLLPLKLNEIIWRYFLQQKLASLYPLTSFTFAFYHHHLAHSASAAFSSPYSDAVVLTLDGRGDGASGSYSTISQRCLADPAYIASSLSLGQIYAEVTRYLGFTPNRHEGKVTGLAARGNPKNILFSFYPLDTLGFTNKILSNFNIARFKNLLTSSNGAYQLYSSLYNVFLAGFLKVFLGKIFLRLSSNLLKTLQYIYLILS